MRLLISNDDGIFAAGVRALANALAQTGHEVTVVCPDRERSATGHGLTLHHPIRAEPVDSVFHPAVTAWSCSGTPSDCVKFALSAVLAASPDWVLAGINQGSNLGTDVLYSGTVSAAMEGAVEGIPSMALSLASFSACDFGPAASFACRALAGDGLLAPTEATLLNVNVPPVPADDIVGVRLARQGLRRYVETFEKRVDPRGNSYYWLAGEAIEDIEQPGGSASDYPTDVSAIRDNHITVTPLQYNLTDVARLAGLAQKPWPELGRALTQSQEGWAE